MSELLYLVSGRWPRFSLGCRPQTGSRINSLEVVTRMRETARNAELWATEGETWRCPAFCASDVVERSDRLLVDGRRRRDFQSSSLAHQNCGHRPPGHTRRSSENAECSDVYFTFMLDYGALVSSYTVNCIITVCCEWTDCRYFLDRHDIAEGSEDQLYKVRDWLSTVCCCVLYCTSFHIFQEPVHVTSGYSACWTWLVVGLICIVCCFMSSY